MFYHKIYTFNDSHKKDLGKHCGEKEKMLLTSIFSFSHNVFKTLNKESPHLIPI